MFTGLIESLQQIKWNRPSPQGRRLCVELAGLAEGARLGDSICVNGVCLTIVEFSGSQAVFDVMSETALVSTLAALSAGELVNLERAMAAGARFAGHLVQGHVDGTGTIERIEQAAGKHVLWIGADQGLLDLMIAKGSVAVDGVSLTIVDVQQRRFSISLIPTTLRETNLGRRKVTDKVNLEADLIGKWIKKRIDEIFGSAGSASSTGAGPTAESAGTLTMERLRQQGFV